MIKRFLGPMAISLATAGVILRFNSIGQIGKAAGYLSVYAFALGGVMKFLFSTVPFLKGTKNAAPTALPPMTLRRVAVRFIVLAKRV